MFLWIKLYAQAAKAVLIAARCKTGCELVKNTKIVPCDKHRNEINLLCGYNRKVSPATTK